MYDTSLASITAEVETLLADRMSAKGRDLEQKLKSVGRRLPKRVREQALYLVQAQSRTKNPKRAAQYDPERVVAAHKVVVDYLSKFDRRAARSVKRLGWFTGMLVNLVLIAIAVSVAVYYLK